MRVFVPTFVCIIVGGCVLCVCVYKYKCASNW